MKQIFIFKDTNYGASKSSGTLNTATTPDQLADGAIGVYGIDPILNAGMLSLITDAAASGGSLVNKSDFKGKEVYIMQGTAEGNRVSSVVPLGDRNLKNITSQAYIAAIKGIFYVGYNGSTGSLNSPAVISRGDEAIIKVNNKTEIIASTTIGKSYSGYANFDGATDYDILSSMVGSIYADVNREIEADIVTNLTGAVFANSATVTLTHGSVAVTTSAVHGVGVGDYVSFNSNVYQAIAIPTTSTMTLDRAYRGVTEVMANASTRDLGATAPTESGLKITDRYVNDVMAISVSGIFVSSTVTQSVNAERSTGRGEDVLKIETDYRPHRGQLDNIDRRKPLPNIYAVETTNYDLYVMYKGADLSNSDFMGAGKVGETELTLGFVETVADTAGKNQSDFEDIMTIFYPDLITLF